MSRKVSEEVTFELRSEGGYKGRHARSLGVGVGNKFSSQKNR